MRSANIKDVVHELADKLPDDATWDDIVHSILIHQAVEEGLADIEAGRTISHRKLKKKWKEKLATKMD